MARLEQARKDSVAAALADQKTRDSLARAQKMRSDSLARVEKFRQDSLVRAEKAYKDSLAQAKQAYADSLARAQKLAKDEDEKQAQLQKQRQDSLLRAEKLYQDSLQRAEKQRADSLARVEKQRQDSLARVEALAIAQAKKDSVARAEEEKRIRLEAERKAKAEEERLAREEAEHRAKLKADSLAHAEAERKQKEKAEKEFQDQVAAVLNGTPIKIDTIVLLSKIQERRAFDKSPDNRVIEAEGILAYRQWNYALSVDAFRKAKALGPLGTRYFAIALTEQNEHAEALKQYAKITDLRADKNTWTHYLRSLVEANFITKAASEYEALLAKYPDDTEGLNWLVAYYRQPLQKEKLLPKLEILLAANPKDPSLLSEVVALTDSSSPRAIEYRERYVKQNPDDIKMKHELAEYYEAKGRRDDALKVYREIAPNYFSDKAFNLKLAEMLLAANKPKEAIAFLEIAANLDGGNKKILLQTAGLHEQIKQNERALEFYNRALALDPKDSAVQAKIVQLSSAKGKQAEKEALLRVVEGDAGAHQANYQLAKISLAEGDKDRAYFYAAKALKSQPDNEGYQAIIPEVAITEAQVLDNLSLLEKAAAKPDAKPEWVLRVAKAELAKKNQVGAARWYSQLYATHPKSLEGEKEAITVLYEAKNMDASGALAERYLAKDPSDRDIWKIRIASLLASPQGDAKLREALTAYSAADPEGASKHLLQLARLDLDAKDIPAAIRHSKAWVDRNPKDLEGLKFQADLLKDRAGEEDAYLSTLSALSALDPKAQGRYARELARLHFRRGDFEEADQFLDKAIKENPGDAALWFRWGEVAQKLHRDELAKTRYGKAYALSSSNAGYAHAYGGYLADDKELKENLALWKFLAGQNPSPEEKSKLAKSLYLNGDFAASALQWDALVKTDAGLAMSEPMVAEAYLRSGQTGKAREIFERKVKNNPDDTKQLERLAELYRQEGNSKGYLSALQSLVKIDPKLKDYQLQLAQESEKAKDYPAALENYDAWVSRNDDDLTALKSMHRLAEQQKDTTRLFEALVRLNRQKTVPQEYKRQLAEIDYARSGAIGGIEKVLQTDKAWSQGQSLVVRDYLRKNDMRKLLPHIDFIEAESKRDASLFEPLGDLYAMQKKNALANNAYLQALKARPKDKALFDKVVDYAKATQSPTLDDVLKLGVGAFPDDRGLKVAYAKSLGKTPPALDVYQDLIEKEPSVEILAQGVDIAVELKRYPLALSWLELWSKKETGSEKVWEKTLSVAELAGNKAKSLEALEKLTQISPQDKGFALELAKAYEEQRQGSKAFEAYQRLLGLDLKNGVVLGKVIALAKTQNKMDDIKDVLLQAEQANPSAHEAQYELAKLYLKDGDKERAYGYLNKALRTQPANAEYQELLPKVVVTEGQILDHLPAIEKLAGQAGASAELQLLAARGNSAKKNTLGAAKWYGMVYAGKRGLIEGRKEPIQVLFAAKNYEAAGQLADLYLQNEPKDPEIRGIQVASLEATKAPASKLREAMTRWVEVDRSAEEKRLMDLAALDLAVRDTAAAVKHAKAWTESHPKDMDAQLFLSPLLKGKAGEDQAYLNTLLALSKGDPKSKGKYDRELAGLYFQRGDFEEAQTYYLAAAAAAAAAPGDAGLWFRLGETETKLRKEASAKKRFEKAYSLSPANPVYARTYGALVDSADEIKANQPLWRYLATQNPSVEERRKLAQSLYLNGDFGGSALQWDYLAKSDPKIGLSEPMVADAYLRSGQTAKARALFEERLKTDPDDLRLLQQVADIYKQEGNAKGYGETLERIVKVDPKFKNYQLLLAQEREKAKNYAGALEAYDDYLSRNEGDMPALLSMHRLSQQQKDTTRLMESLIRLTRQKNAGLEFKRQLAEIDFIRNKNVAGLEKQVNGDANWVRGKSLLVRYYLKNNQTKKLLPFSPFLFAESKRDPELLEPLGDVYAMQKKTLPANNAYVQALRATPKDRELFDKALKYGKATGSPYQSEILKLGYQNFSDDIDVKLAYAKTLGNTQAALEVYADVLEKQPTPENLSAAADLAIALQKWPQAFAWLEKWSQVDSKNPEVWAKTISASQKAGNKEKERKALQGLINEVPGAGSKRLLDLAELDLAFKDTAAALEHGKQWFARNPNDLAGLQFLYPLVKSNAAEKDTYLKILQGLAANDKKAAGKYDLELGSLYFERGDLEEAQSILSKSLAKNNKDAALWYRLGEIEKKLRKDEQAKLKFKTAYGLAPNSLTYARTYGESLSKPDELKATLPLWRFLATQNPSIDERRKLAQSLFLNGDFAASSLQWDWFMKGDPSIGQTEPMVSEAYLKSGQTAKARAIFEARLKNEPTNLQLLEQLADIYKKEGNAKGYLDILSRIVQTDPKHKNYLLLLAQEKEKAKDYSGALDAYDAWVAKNDADVATLKNMHDLSERQKDTTRLMESLVRLTRQKQVDPQYRFQMAEIDYARTRNISEVEKLVKTYPKWDDGKALVVRHYGKKGEMGKLVPYTPFLAALAKKDAGYYEILGDLYAFRKLTAQANSSYLSAIAYDKKDKGLFDKAYDYAKKTKSPYQATLLKQGYQNFPEDLDIKSDYAAALGKTPKALELYQEILGRDKNKLDALRAGSEIAFSLRKYDDAAPLLQHWTSVEPKEVRPWELLVELFTQTKKEDKLAEALARVSDLQPKDSKAAFEAGMAYKKINEKNKALEYFAKAVTLNDKNPAYAKEYGLASLQAGRADNAKGPLLLADRFIKSDEEINYALYQIYVADKNDAEARQRLRNLNAIKPTKLEYAFALAKLESKLKAPAEVIKVLERPVIKDALDAEMSFLLLDAYFKTGQKDRAGKFAPVLLRKFPNESRSSLPLGVLFYETNDKAKAKDILEAYSRGNSSEEARYYLGRIYFDEKNWGKAIDSFNQAGDFKDDIPELLGEAYIKNNQPGNAISVFEKLYAKTKDAKVLKDLYTLYKKTKDTRGLTTTLERLVDDDPKNLDYRVELAELYRLGGDSKKAEDQFSAILKKSPAHPGANLFMGMALAERKDYDRAVRMLEIGTARYPDTLRAWKLLAAGYREQKKAPQALKAYKRVLKDEPQNLEAAVGRMELSEQLKLTAELPDAYADVVRLDSNNLDAGIALAAIRHDQRRYKESVPIYAHVVRKKTDDKEIWANFGIGLLELNRIQDAKNALQKAVDLGAKDMKILTSLARIYKEEGNVDKAEFMLSEMVKKDPRNHMAWYELGRIAVGRNQDGVAEENYKKALQLSSGTPEYAEALAQVYYSKDDFAGVMRVLGPVRSKLGEDGNLLYGMALMKVGRTDAALEVFTDLYSHQKSPKVLAKLAELKVLKGETREALRLIKESGFENDSSVQFSLAKAYLSEGEAEKSRDVVDDLLKRNKYNAELYHLRGMSYYQEGDCRRANKDFDKALKYDPDLMDAVYYTGMCLLKDERNKDAQNYFKELSQHNNPSFAARGFLGMGLVFESEKKWEAADNFLQKSVEKFELPDAYNGLARVYLKLRRPGDAEKMARKAIALEPENPNSLGVLAEILVAQNRRQEALAMAKKALQENPNSCPLLESSAKINYLAGNYETARQNGQYAISRCPDNANPYLYVALVAEKKFDKKTAKTNFKKYLKNGGDKEMVPKDYR